MTTLYWLQQGGCGGDTLSFLNTETPDLPDLFADLGIHLLWHPSLSDRTPSERAALEDRILADDEPLDVLVVEGSVVQGPEGTGMFDTHRGGPKRDFAAIRATVASTRFPEVGQVTVSVGVVEHAAQESQETLLKRVDDALYEAKEGGRNRVVEG